MRIASHALTPGGPLDGWPPAPVTPIDWTLGRAAEMAAASEPALGYEGAFPFLAAASEGAARDDPPGAR